MSVQFERQGLRNATARSLLLGRIEEAFAAVDPRVCVRQAAAGTLRDLERRRPAAGGGTSHAVAIGKAAAAMSAGLADSLGTRLSGGICLAPHGASAIVPRMDFLTADHPVPDLAGVRAARAIGKLADRAGPDDTVWCLLSGGGSALFPSPPPGVSLRDLAELTRILLASGAPIDELNSIRRHVSTLQGGQLARRLHPAHVATLVISDVVTGRLETIASGPTVPDPTTFADAKEVLVRRRLWPRVPPAVREYISAGVRGDAPETPKPFEPFFAEQVVRVIADNRTFVDAVCSLASAAGSDVVRWTQPMVGEAREVGRDVGRRLRELARTVTGPTWVVAGGETTVTVRGRGRGGRNQEVALAAARELDGVDGVTVVALATDGVDGPTDAAGGVIDGRTVSELRQQGIEPGQALEDNDTYAALAACGDLLRSGPTGTNVADVLVGVVTPR